MKNFLQNKNLQICKNCKNFSLPELAKLRAVIWYPWSLSYSLPFAKGHPWWTWGWLVWPLKTFKILGLASKLTEWRLRDTKIQLSDVNSWWRHFHVMTRSEILCERPLVGCGYTIPWVALLYVHKRVSDANLYEIWLMENYLSKGILNN